MPKGYNIAETNRRAKGDGVSSRAQRLLYFLNSHSNWSNTKVGSKAGVRVRRIEKLTLEEI